MNKDKIKVVLLAGGKGTRIREETDITPKPCLLYTSDAATTMLV